MTVQVIDTKNDGAMTIDTNAPDARSMMLASASAIAAFVIESEGKLADTAKAWGHALFRAVYVDGANMDGMIGDSKVAAGWSVLTTNETGKKAKARLEVYFSNARKVAEAWGGMEQAARDDVLAGLSSIHYIAGQLRKAEADAKRAADKAAKLAKAEQEAADAKEEASPAIIDPHAERDASQRKALDHAVYTVADGYSPLNMVRFAATDESVTLEELLSLVARKMIGASDADIDAAYPTLEAIIASVDARINAAADAEPVSLAA